MVKLGKLSDEKRCDYNRLAKISEQFIVSLNSNKLDFKQQTSTFTDSTASVAITKRIDHEQQKKEAEKLLNKKRLAKVQNNV